VIRAQNNNWNLPLNMSSISSTTPFGLDGLTPEFLSTLKGVGAAFLLPGCGPLLQLNTCLKRDAIVLQDFSASMEPLFRKHPDALRWAYDDNQIKFMNQTMKSNFDSRPFNDPFFQTSVVAPILQLTASLRPEHLGLEIVVITDGYENVHSTMTIPDALKVLFETCEATGAIPNVMVVAIGGGADVLASNIKSGVGRKCTVASIPSKLKKGEVESVIRRATQRAKKMSGRVGPVVVGLPNLKESGYVEDDASDKGATQVISAEVSGLGASAEAFEKAVIDLAEKKLSGTQKAWVKARKEKASPTDIATEMVKLVTFGLSKPKGTFAPAEYFSGKSGIRASCNDLCSLFSKKISAVGGFLFCNAVMDEKGRPQYTVKCIKA